MSRPLRRGRLLALPLAFALVTAACGRSAAPPPKATTKSAPPSPSAPPVSHPSRTPKPADLHDVHVALTRIASLDSPLALAVRPNDDRLYIAEQNGLLVSIPHGGGDPKTVLDLRDEVTFGGEQGLLGLAFSPDGDFLYVNYTDNGGDTNVVEYATTATGVDRSSARRVLFVDQPFPNHNGGNLAFGPDGYLYIGLGDGGSQGDPNGNGQNLGVLLAKMLRIDPRPSGGKPYGIPADNPFVGRKGARPEVWAYGLRNPWRYSFDRDTGDLWIGDVGGSLREEIDFQPASSHGGENYGWNQVEGTEVTGTEPPDAVPPVYDYDHSGGNCVVTGGYVYRGAKIPALQGAYLFADFCVGHVMALRRDGSGIDGPVDIGVATTSPASFGEDADGELYVLSLSGDVFRIDPA